MYSYKMKMNKALLKKGHPHCSGYQGHAAQDKIDSIQEFQLKSVAPLVCLEEFNLPFPLFNCFLQEMDQMFML